MAKLVWDAAGDRQFEIGVSKGILFLEDGSGVVWNGLKAVDEAPSGGTSSPYYLDGKRFLNEQTREEFSASITALTYPVEFESYDGTNVIGNGLLLGQAPRKMFTLCYRTELGNDLEGVNLGYQIHIIYNCLASPTNKSRQSIGDTSSPLTFNWGITTIPVVLAPGLNATGHVIIDSRTTDASILAPFEAYIYGTSETDSALPTPAELYSMFLTLVITDNLDNTWTATGPDDLFTYDPFTHIFTISWPSAVPTSADEYTISSL
jgi:hypothetical protein